MCLLLFAFFALLYSEKNWAGNSGSQFILPTAVFWGIYKRGKQDSFSVNSWPTTHWNFCCSPLFVCRVFKQLCFTILSLYTTMDHYPAISNCQHKAHHFRSRKKNGGKRDTYYQAKGLVKIVMGLFLPFSCLYLCRMQTSLVTIQDGPTIEK